MIACLTMVHNYDDLGKNALQSMKHFQSWSCDHDVSAWQPVLTLHPTIMRTICNFLYWLPQKVIGEAGREDHKSQVVITSCSCCFSPKDPHYGVGDPRDLMLDSIQLRPTLAPLPSLAPAYSPCWPTHAP